MRMSWFKRLCLFVFGLSGLLALTAMGLAIVDNPWNSQVRSLLFESRWFFVALVVVAGIAAFGLLVLLLMSLFTPRNPKETIVAEVEGGKITVTRSAIVSQTRHIIEDDGTCVANSIRVKVRRRGHVRVGVRVMPLYPMDVVKRGEMLYAALESGLREVCGDSVSSIDLVFREPQPQVKASIGTTVKVEQDDGATQEVRMEEPAPVEDPAGSGGLRMTVDSGPAPKVARQDIAVKRDALASPSVEQDAPADSETTASIVAMPEGAAALEDEPEAKSRDELLGVDAGEEA